MMLKKLLLIIMFIACINLVSAASYFDYNLTFNDNFDSGNPFDNGWRNVAGSMQEFNGYISGTGALSGTVGQNFTNSSFKYNQSFEIQLRDTIIAGSGDLYRLYLTDDTDTSYDHYILFTHSQSGLYLTCQGDCSCTSDSHVQTVSGYVTILYNASTHNISVYGVPAIKSLGSKLLETTVSGCDFKDYDLQIYSSSALARVLDFELYQYFPPCIPSWSCTQYSECINNTRTCLSWTDANSCGYAYSASNESSCLSTTTYYTEDFEGASVVLIAFLIWAMLLVIALYSKDVFFVIVCGVFGVLFSLWMWNNVAADIPTLIIAVYGFINGYILVVLPWNIDKIGGGK